MLLKNLISELQTIHTIAEDVLEQTVRGIAEDSRQIQPGYLFVAISGFGKDGHHFIGNAIENGASFIVGEAEGLQLPVPYLQVADSRKALGILAKAFYHNPSKAKLMIGITGTNGKTTTSYLLKQIFESAGRSCTVMGTIQNIINGQVAKSSNTTPNSLVAHQLLAKSTDDVVIMEVSSHGLSQHRIEGLEFDFCLFTNLHHEHLDYHDTLSEYFQAKSRLFDFLKPGGAAVVGTDTIWGTKLLGQLQTRGLKTFAVGETEENKGELAFDVKNSRIRLVEDGKKVHVPSPLAGMHNLLNTLMAYCTARAAGLPQEDILAALHQFTGVAGRFETFKLPTGATVIIDYAHTPDALLHVLTTAKQLDAKRIVHIFGFRGNRDISKRKDMLSICSELSGQYILTMDDLNSVAYSDMLSDLVRMNEQYGNEKGIIMPDRTLAIKFAMENSKPGDFIIITGKGHETYQQSYELPAQSDQEAMNYVLSDLETVSPGFGRQVEKSLF
ncbi:UDP-N-acetylmuramoyl-L-alanyl-D-glutamate--2,6-diaminopimelate ligase [Planomicrobium sp. CPCC 101110]|uniref:UDP-N-acetylmuramoyl-L-alanyl-D-glutamate--2, 6-diaminopimelate ligase n=1 Tax=Planomicrobium sp. CPCC 101110 TaxID=2599619 RepID=UPI0011B7C4BD|nr:UDP-N-acetylmuramoyl-L-alanyl-D-glutamate--2,6-diaminopimelate ligase [Planomicrobium sp. CPCC 101110]TWT25950.1 UDP-N-acetylmuramoyl-L-alanyl-D-glutamate--2,6-diaminopimelate ligase [Planomicrobium sp. CPCC 101110]